MTVKEYASLHGRSPRRVQQLIADGKLKARWSHPFWGDGKFYIERLFDDNGSPLKG